MSQHTAPVLGELVDQPGRRPTAKLLATGASGIATGVVLYVARRAGLELPETVAEAVVLLGAWIGGYVKRDKAVAAVVTRVQHALAPFAPLAEAALPVLEQATGTKPVAMIGATERVGNAVADGGAETTRGPETA